MFGFGKGKIEIQLNKFQFSPGETVEGKVSLSLKKPLQGKGVSVGVVGEQRTSSGYGRNRSSRTTPIFNFSLPLDGEKEYPAGELVYPFKIKIPENVYSGQQSAQGATGTILKTIQILSTTSSRISWYVTAKLDVPGFDVNKKVQINVG